MAIGLNIQKLQPGIMEVKIGETIEIARYLHIGFQINLTNANNQYIQENKNLFKKSCFKSMDAEKLCFAFQNEINMLLPEIEQKQLIIDDIQSHLIITQANERIVSDIMYEQINFDLYSTIAEKVANFKYIYGLTEHENVSHTSETLKDKEKLLIEKGMINFVKKHKNKLESLSYDIDNQYIYMSSIS